MKPSASKAFKHLVALTLDGLGLIFVVIALHG
jgi:hypothetical protein